MLRPGTSEQPRDFGALVSGGSGEPLAQFLRACINPQLAAGLRVHQPEFPDIWKFLFSGVANLHGKYCVSSAEFHE